MNWQDVETWVKDFQRGDHDGSKVIEYLEPTLKKIITAGHSYKWGSYEDALQMARIFLWEAMKDFNPNAGMSFKNFALMRIKDRLNHKQASLEVPVEEFEDIPDESFDYDIIDALKKFEVLLTPMEYKCLVGKSSGLKAKEIAEKYGYQITQVNDAIKRAKSKICNKMSNGV